MSGGVWVTRQQLLRWAAVVGPGVIAVSFETVRHAYLDRWLTETQGNVATGVLVIAASALLLVQIFRRLDEWEDEARRAQARQIALEERDRVAADLHDYVSQSLFYFNVKLTEVQRSLGSQRDAAARSASEPVAPHTVGADRTQRATELARHLEDMRTALGELYDRIRQTIFDLKVYDAQKTAEFTALVRNHVDRFRERTGMAVTVAELTHRCGPDCPEAEQELFRILQEALNNVYRHARASNVRVLLRSDAQSDTLIVEDDGCGFNAATAPGVDAGHFGLTLMRERAENLGGKLFVDSRRGRGTAIRFQRIHEPLRDVPVNGAEVTHAYGDRGRHRDGLSAHHRAYRR